MNCPFCDLKEERIIEETKNTFTILSNPAIVKGHLLVIPKRHAEKLSELNGDEKIELFNQVIKMQEILLRKFSGCDIRQNYRPFQAQDSLKVNHLHIHLQPREFEDELYKSCQIYEKTIFKELDKEEINKAKEFILK